MDVVKLTEGVFVEISEALPGNKASKSGDRLEEAGETVNKVLAAVANKLSPIFAREPAVEVLEITMGLKFSAEGTIFIAKTTGQSTLDVKISLKRRV